MTEIQTTDLTAAKIDLRDGNKSLRQVAAELAGDTLSAPVMQASTTEVDFPPVPTVKVITKEDREALLAFPRVFAQVMPDTRRTLTPQEVVALHAERKVLKRIEPLIKGREENIGEYLRTHVDVDAVKGKKASDDTLRDAKGHYILAAPQKPTRIPVEGTNEAFSLEYRAGSKGEVYIDGEALLALYEAGEITRKQYLALTSERRVFDEAKALAASVKDPSLLPILAKVVRKSSDSKPGTSLFVRKSE